MSEFAAAVSKELSTIVGKITAAMCHLDGIFKQQAIDMPMDSGDRLELIYLTEDWVTFNISKEILVCVDDYQLLQGVLQRPILLLPARNEQTLRTLCSLPMYPNHTCSTRHMWLQTGSC